MAGTALLPASVLPKGSQKGTNPFWGEVASSREWRTTSLEKALSRMGGTYSQRLHREAQRGNTGPKRRVEPRRARTVRIQPDLAGAYLSRRALNPVHLMDGTLGGCTRYQEPRSKQLHSSAAHSCRIYSHDWTRPCPKVPPPSLGGLQAPQWNM